MKRQINQNVQHNLHTSSTLKSSGYDEKMDDLHVTFKDGGRYVYHDVTPEVYEAFKMAGSKGGFLHKNVKGNFEFTKL